MLGDPAGFILANTTLCPVPHVPEIRLHVADEALPIWEKTEEELGAIGLPPPFWAFAWAGGQALARYLLDNPHLVSGTVLTDFASGSGLVAIAACLAGAKSVLATDIDPICAAAMALNARANAVRFDIEIIDITELPSKGRDIVCAGDVFYELAMADRIVPFLEREQRAGATILIGDPGRSYLPRERLVKLADYQVPVTRALEDSDIKATSVWTLRPTEKDDQPR
jgi:predicted nicotinamide N-methyase